MSLLPCIDCDLTAYTPEAIFKKLIVCEDGGDFKLNVVCCDDEAAVLLQAATEGESNTLKTIGFPHHEIHEGYGYCLPYPITIPAANEVEIRIQTPNTTRWAHMVWAFTNDSDYTVDVFEDTTKTDVVGNRLTPVNANRNSGNLSGLTVCHTPAGAGDGNVIWSFAGGANKQASTVEGRHEFILKQNTAYLINLSGALNDVAHILLDWYEHINS